MSKGFEKGQRVTVSHAAGEEDGIVVAVMGPDFPQATVRFADRTETTFGFDKLRATGWTIAKVSLDDLGPYDAEVADFRWNGFAVPRFSREVAERVVADITAANAETIASVPSAVHEVTFVEWVEDAQCEGQMNVLLTDFRGTPDEMRDLVTPDGDQMYAIGGCSWCWTTERDER
jgi:hypothetical protein